MITVPQDKFYFWLWTRAKKKLLNGRETWSELEEDNHRHELHVRALGYDKSHYDLTNREFDKVIAELRAIIDPSDLNGQLRQINMRANRMRWGMRKLMAELRLADSYVAGIVKRMNENGELGSSRLDCLDADELRKVMVALRKHEERVAGVKLQPAA